MVRNAKSKDGGIYPIRLHFELKNEYLSNRDRIMLGRYGEAPSGLITRDILIPSDMPLHNLHYVIQKLFGWQNSHLRMFYLPENIFLELTQGTVRDWSGLVGTLFQPPSEAEQDVFWDDDYKSGSITTWLRRKYSGPYGYGGLMEHWDEARHDMETILEHFQEVKVRESFADHMMRKQRDPDAEIMIHKTVPLIEMTLEEMDSSLNLGGDAKSLMERLIINELLAFPEEDLAGGGAFPVTKELFYDYDFGDGWSVIITKLNTCDDLLRENVVDSAELKKAMNQVVSAHGPVCIARQGVNVLDDVGGLSGFSNFLETIYEGEDKEEASSLRTWAKSLGWSTAKGSIWKTL